MIGPWAWVKRRWYRRRAKLAILFLRRMDRVAILLGWNSAKIRSMWRDFIEHPSMRSQALDEMSVANKIRIKMESEGRYHKAWLLGREKYFKLLQEHEHNLTKLELEKARAEISRCSTKADEIIATIVDSAPGGQQKESAREVPAL